MSILETLILALALAIAIPAVCARWRRLPLAYPAFIVAGLIIGPLLTSDARSALGQAGQVGFLLLLFEVGLEIDLPSPRQLLRPLRYVLMWSAAQYPIIFAAAHFAGLTWSQSFLGAAALTACSVGLAYSAWKDHPTLTGPSKAFVLQVMVLLELAAVALISLQGAALEEGASWLLLFKLTGLIVAVVLISRFSERLRKLFQQILERTTLWRVHWLLMLVLAVSALGERLGLSAAKTAFFLGLFLRRIEHHGQKLEACLAPVSQRLLIPLFFIALGTRVRLDSLASHSALLALATALVLLAWRQMVHRRWLHVGSDDTHLLFGPNLTLVALAAAALAQAGAASAVVSWLILTGLFMSVAAVLALKPSGQANSNDSQPLFAPIYSLFRITSLKPKTKETT